MGIAALIAVATYFRSYLQQQGERLREHLFACESDLNRLYREFDQRALMYSANQIISHPRMRAFAETVCLAEKEEEKSFEKIVDEFKWDVGIAVLSAITLSGPMEREPYDQNYRITMDKVRVRYPVLYVFLSRIHRVMVYCISVIEKPDIYRKLIIDTVKKMKTEGDIEKMKTSDKLPSFIYTVILLNITRLVKNQRLNEALKALREIQTIFFDHYRERGDLGLWLLSKKETPKVAASCTKGYVSDTLRAIVQAKARYFGKEELSRISEVVGKVETIMKMEIEE